MTGAVIPATRPAVFPAVLPATDPRMAGMGGNLFVLGNSYAPSQGDECIVPIPDAAAAVGCGPVHPSVLYFPQGWNGKKYWMAYTPFTGNQAVHENPCIVCSDDGVTWTVPGELTNPIDNANEFSPGFFADVCLVHNPEDDKLYCFWTLSTPTYYIFGRSSSDGVNWGANRFVVHSWLKANYWGASPALLPLGNGAWRMWAINADSPTTNNNAATMWTATAPALTGPWGDKQTCSFVPYLNSMWHLEVRKVGGKFLALVTHHQIRSATFGLGPQVAESTDGINFVATGKHFLGWAGRTTSSEVYKASMVIHRDFSVGKVWQMTSSGVDKLRVSQIKTNAPESLQSDWIDTAITAAIAAEAPYFIGDRFDRADATLKDTLAESGQQWLQGSGSNHPVISNKAVMRGAADPSYAAINIGQSNMTVGFRVNQPSRTEQWELEAKSNRSISASRISLYWNASILTLRSVTSVAAA
nr:hypothetical protein [Akkermansiaceae bacterium]